MKLTKQQKVRYKRQIIIPEIGIEGQYKLCNAKVLIVGCGGLGSSCAYYLCAAGIGTIGLADSDKVKVENLQRQILHFTEDIGVPKVRSAKEKLCKLNPDTKINIYQLRLNSKNVLDIIKTYDIVVDCSDNLSTKYMLNKSCVQTKKPLVHASVTKFYGQAMTVIPYEGPCYRCIFSELSRENFNLCHREGILGIVAGIFGMIEAAEVIKYILGIGDLLVGKLLIFDILEMELKKIKVKKDKTCPVCGSRV